MDARRSIKTIRKSPDHDKEKIACKVKGIVRVKDWFINGEMPGIYENFFVVGVWFEYPDGVNDNPECMQTLAITRHMSDAEQIYDAQSLIG